MMKQPVERTVEEQIADLDQEMLDLTWQRVALGNSAKDQIKWEALMVEIETLRAKQTGLKEKQLDSQISF